MFRKLFVAAALSLCLLFAVPALADDTTGYPQHQTKEMVDFFKDAGCEIYGAYEVEGMGVMIVWGRCKDSKACESFMAGPFGILPFKSCGEGFEVYKEVCKAEGKCS